MNQLVTINKPLEFLDKTDLSSAQELADYLSEIYIHSFELIHEMDSAPFETEWVPSHYSLVATSWHWFEERYLHYVLNGNDSDEMDFVMDKINEGYDTDDIMDSWQELKEFNASFKVTYTRDNMEYAMMRDIMTLLDQFHFTYFMDDRESFFSNPDEIRIKNWVNPPIVEVW